MLTIEDRLDMIELVARYNQAIDNGDGEAWTNTFTKNGVFRIVCSRKAHGHEELAQLVCDTVRNNKRGYRHWAGNFVIDGDGDAARMTAYFMGVVNRQIAATGRYRNELRKMDGEWKFTLREYTNDPAEA